MEFYDEIYECVTESLKDYLKSIKDDILKLYQRAVQEKVYNRLNPPLAYKRQDMLRDDVEIDESEIDNGVLYLLHRPEKRYYSVYRNIRSNGDITPYIPILVDEGHDDDNVPIQNDFFHYEGRKYLEYAQKLIQKETGLDVEIIKDIERV